MQIIQPTRPAVMAGMPSCCIRLRRFAAALLEAGFCSKVDFVRCACQLLCLPLLYRSGSMARTSKNAVTGRISH